LLAQVNATYLIVISGVITGALAAGAPFITSGVLVVSVMAAGTFLAIDVVQELRAKNAPFYLSYDKIIELHQQSDLEAKDIIDKTIELIVEESANKTSLGTLR